MIVHDLEKSKKSVLGLRVVVESLTSRRWELKGKVGVSPRAGEGVAKETQTDLGINGSEIHSTRSSEVRTLQ